MWFDEISFEIILACFRETWRCYRRQNTCCAFVRSAHRVFGTVFAQAEVRDLLNGGPLPDLPFLSCGGADAATPRQRAAASRTPE